jgi:hypothetical protein
MTISNLRKLSRGRRPRHMGVLGVTKRGFKGGREKCCRRHVGDKIRDGIILGLGCLCRTRITRNRIVKNFHTKFLLLLI